MKTKSLWKISILTTPEAEDAVAEMLGAILDQPASIYFDLETGVSRVAVYLEQKPVAPRKMRKSLHEGLRQINCCGLNTGPGRVTVSKIRREDWAESWKRHFQLIEFGDQLLIKPSWSKRRARKNQAVVVLDPGLSFGTGQHPTTEFCLSELVRCGKNKAARSFLDIGTGSGILAITAAKLGYSPVHAFDFDPDAVRIARSNASANGVQNQVRISRADVTKLPVLQGQKYGLICANLISTLLIAEHRRITNSLQRDGTLVLAGILKSEFTAVRKIYAKLGLKLALSKNGKEWRSGSFSFPKKSIRGKFE